MIQCMIQCTVRMILLEAIAQNLKSIAAGVTAGDPRVMGRVLRSFAQLRRTMEPEVLKALLEDSVGKHDFCVRLSNIRHEV